MIKKTFYSLLFLVLLSTNSYSAGSDSTTKVKSDYSKAVTLIKAAKNYEKKGKIQWNERRTHGTLLTAGILCRVMLLALSPDSDSQTLFP